MCGSRASRTEDQRKIECGRVGKGVSSRLDPRLFDFLRRILTLKVAEKEGVELALRFQQISGGGHGEGCQGYSFLLIQSDVALNEVGGDPDCFGVAAPSSMSGAAGISSIGRARCWPRPPMTPSAARTSARVCFCSRRTPSDGARVSQWADINQPYRSARYRIAISNIICTSRSPARGRSKGSRLIHTRKRRFARPRSIRWTDPDPDYEAAVRKFIEGIYDDTRSISAVEEFVAAIIMPAGQLACPDPGQTDRAGCTRFLPGHRAVGPLAGRSR